MASFVISRSQVKSSPAEVVEVSPARRVVAEPPLELLNEPDADPAASKPAEAPLPKAKLKRVKIKTKESP